MIQKLHVKSAGKNLYNIADAYKAVFIKNLLDFSDDYARSTARSQFWYLDTAESVVLDDNLGIKERQDRTKRVERGGNPPQVVETIIPLNRYSFFEDLEDKIPLPMQLEFNITLQDDTELIWQDEDLATSNRRVVVRNFELWVPSLQFTSEGQKLVNENFLKPVKWHYLREITFSSTLRTDANETWQITLGLKNAKDVFGFNRQEKQKHPV